MTNTKGLTSPNSDNRELTAAAPQLMTEADWLALAALPLDYWRRLDVPDQKAVCGHWFSQHGDPAEIAECAADLPVTTAPMGTF